MPGTHSQQPGTEEEGGGFGAQEREAGRDLGASGGAKARRVGRRRLSGSTRRLSLGMLRRVAEKIKNWEQTGCLQQAAAHCAIARAPLAVGGGFGFWVEWSGREAAGQVGVERMSVSDLERRRLLLTLKSKITHRFGLFWLHSKILGDGMLRCQDYYQYHERRPPPWGARRRSYSCYSVHMTLAGRRKGQRR